MSVKTFPDIKRLARIREALSEAKAESAERFEDVHALMAGNAQKARMWKLRTKDDAQAMLDALTQYTSMRNKRPSAYVDDPKIDGEVVPGKFRQVRALRHEGPDGKPRIVQILQRVYKPLTVTELAGLTARRTRKNEILAPFGLQPGEGDKEAWVFPDLDPDAEAKCLWFADATLVSQLPGSGWTYVDRSFDEQENNTATFTVVFGKLALRTAADVAALAALGHDETQENEILAPFGLQPGEGDVVAHVWDNMNPSGRATLLALADADLVTHVSGAGWTYVDRKFDTEKFQFVVVFRKVAWNAWDHDEGAADITEYDNAGTANEKEGITKTWLGIRNSDLAAARAALRDGTGHFAAESGYIITAVRIGDNNNGSITFTQAQKKQVTNKDVGVAATPGQRIFNPHGWDGGRIDAIETHYEHFTAAGLAAAISGEAAPADYTLADLKPGLAGDGLYSLIYTYEKPTWSNVSGSTPNKVLADKRTLGYTNYDPQNATGGLNRTVTKGGKGIPIADLEEIRDNQAADAGHALDGIDIADDGDGSGSLRSRQTKANAIADAEVKRVYVHAVGRQEAKEQIVWLNVTEADADLVVADAEANEDDMTGATYEAAAAGHLLSWARKLNHATNVLFDVVRETTIPRGSSRYSYDDDDGTEKLVDKYIATFRMTSAVKTRTPKTVSVNRKVFGASADAWAYVDKTGAGGQSTEFYSDDDNSVLVHKGRVRYLGDDKWEAFQVTLGAYS